MFWVNCPFHLSPWKQADSIQCLKQHCATSTVRKVSPFKHFWTCIWKCFKFRCPVGSICILTLSVMRPLLRVCWLIISLAKCQSLRSHGSDILPKVFPFLQTSIFCALFFLFVPMFTLFLTSLSTVSGRSLCFQPLPLIIVCLSQRAPAEAETDSKSDQINCFYLGLLFSGGEVGKKT